MKIIDKEFTSKESFKLDKLDKLINIINNLHRQIKHIEATLRGYNLDIYDFIYMLVPYTKNATILDDTIYCLSKVINSMMSTLLSKIEDNLRISLQGYYALKSTPELKLEHYKKICLSVDPLQQLLLDCSNRISSILGQEWRKEKLKGFPSYARHVKQNEETLRLMYIIQEEAESLLTTVCLCCDQYKDEKLL
jgi:hypothetical protein